MKSRKMRLYSEKLKVQVGHYDELFKVAYCGSCVVGNEVEDAAEGLHRLEMHWKWGDHFSGHEWGEG